MSDSTPFPLKDIKPKMKFEGKVTRVELAGARIDIGAEVDAFLHVSQIKSDRPLTRVADFLKEGEAITVWVKQIKPDQNLVSLTMFEPPALDWNDLQKRMRLTGKVVRVEEFGAFVNIGAPKDGLVAVGQMAKTRVNKPSDIVKEGDEVTVWVTQVNRKENRIGLTMVEPPALDWNEIKRGQTVTGKVTRLEKFGAFVEFGAEREGMIHVSEIGSGYIEHPSELLKIGEEVEAKVLDIDPRKKQIRLSIKAVESELATQEEAETPLMTPMEIAFQQAQRRSHAATGKRGPATGSESLRAQQEDIFRRTLREHANKS